MGKAVAEFAFKVGILVAGAFIVLYLADLAM